MTCPKCKCPDCRTDRLKAILRKYFPKPAINDNDLDPEAEMLRRIAEEMGANV